MVGKEASINRSSSKLTDYFVRKPSSSQPSSQLSSSQQRSTRGAKSSPHTKSSALTWTQSSSVSQSLGKRKLKDQMVSSQKAVRPTKKENAPPAHFTTNSVIYVTSDTPSYISVSSGSASHISVSSASVKPSSNRGRPKKKNPGCQLPIASNVQLISQVSRSRNSRSHSRSNVNHLIAVEHQLKHDPKLKTGSSPVKAIVSVKQKVETKKRTKSILLDDSSLGELTDANEVTIATTKAKRLEAKIQQSVLVTPNSKSRLLNSSPPKKKRRLNATDMHLNSRESGDEEIIPSSQSDEKELVAPKRYGKNLKQVEASVRAWQETSQTQAECASSKATDVTVDSDCYTSLDQDTMVDFPAQYDTTGDFTEYKKNCSFHGSTVVASNELVSGDIAAIIDIFAFSDHSVNTPCSALRIAKSICDSSSTPSRALCRSSPLTCRRTLSDTTKPSSELNALSPNAVSSSSSLTKAAESGTVEITTSKIQNSPFPDVIDEVQMPSPRLVPNILDVKTKTADIIRQMKEKAAAIADISDDEKSQSDLGELSSGSDIEELEFLTKARKKSGLEKQITLSPADNDSDCTSSHKKVPFRSTSASPPPTVPTVRTRFGRVSRVPQGAIPVTVTRTSVDQNGMKKGADPFTKLMKDKNREFWRAASQANFTHISCALSDSDESVSKRTPRSATNCRFRSLSQESIEDTEFEDIVRKKENFNLLGKVEGEVASKMLESALDERKSKGKARDVALGIPFWEQPIEHMLGDDVYDLLPLEGIDFGPLQALASGVNNLDGALMLIQAIGIASPCLKLTDCILPWLFEAALSTHEVVAQSSYTALSRTCQLKNHERLCNVFIPLACIVRVLAKLGAKSDVLASLDLELPSVTDASVNSSQRRNAIWRLVNLTHILGCHKLFFDYDVPSLISLLMAIGMDASTDFDLRQDIVTAIEVLCNGYCGSHSHERSDIEKAICSKILCLVNSHVVDPANKALLLSFLPGGTLLVKRVAQWVAFALLTNELDIEPAVECIGGLPPLTSVIDILDPSSGNGESKLNIFTIRRGDLEAPDEFDYAALGYHTEILSYVLMNIPLYVQIEQEEKKCESMDDGVTLSQTSVSSRPSSPIKKHQTRSKLEHIKTLLDRLYSKIDDHRATHLDRSKTKTIIQHLGMRIHYQRLSAQGGSRTLDKFFPKRHVL